MCVTAKQIAGIMLMIYIYALKGMIKVNVNQSKSKDQGGLEKGNIIIAMNTMIFHSSYSYEYSDIPL